MRYAIVVNNIVENVAISDYPVESNWVQSDTAGKGDLYQDGNFIPQPIPSEIAAEQVRTERNQRLADCDYVTLRSTDQGVVVPVEWVTYRQALRDITDNVNFPYLTPTDWPVKP
jgi:hypothetical protein